VKWRWIYLWCEATTFSVSLQACVERLQLTQISHPRTTCSLLSTRSDLHPGSSAVGNCLGWDSQARVLAGSTNSSHRLLGVSPPLSSPDPTTDDLGYYTRPPAVKVPPQSRQPATQPVTPPHLNSLTISIGPPIPVAAATPKTVAKVVPPLNAVTTAADVEEEPESRLTITWSTEGLTDQEKSSVVLELVSTSSATAPPLMILTGLKS
jgi:hypothetical protein